MRLVILEKVVSAELTLAVPFPLLFKNAAGVASLAIRRSVACRCHCPCHSLACRMNSLRSKNWPLKRVGRYPATSFTPRLLLSLRSDAQPVSAEQMVLTDPIV